MGLQIKQILFFIFLFALSFSDTAAQEQKTSLEIPTVAFCDIVRQPALYDNKVVRIKAKYLVAFEGSVMSDTACEETAWVKFDSSVEKLTPRKVWKKFDRWTDVSPIHKNNSITYPTGEVIVTWVGLFQGIKPAQKIGKINLSLGFGHMNSYDFQFVVQKIEEVSKPNSNEK